MARTRKALQKEGRNEGYDRKCAGLSQEQVEEKLAKGEKSIVRFKVRFASSSHRFARADWVEDVTVEFESRFDAEGFDL